MTAPLWKAASTSRSRFSLLAEVADAELVEQHAEVGLHRVDAEEQLGGDVGVRGGTPNPGESLNGRQSASNTLRCVAVSSAIGRMAVPTTVEPSPA